MLRWHSLSRRRALPERPHWSSSANRSDGKSNAGGKKPPEGGNASAGRRRSRKAQAAFDEAREKHDAEANAIEAERAAVDKKAEDEEARWK
jgi:colicin import membrane protein